MSSWTKYIVCIPTYIGEVARDGERERAYGLRAGPSCMGAYDHAINRENGFFVQHAIAIFGIGFVWLR